MPIHLNTAEFDKQVAVRGLTMREFAREAGLSEATISRARHGGVLRTSTLGAMARALIRLKPLRGVAEMDLITATPVQK